LSVGSHTVAFSTVTGWTTPGSQTPNIVANQTTQVTGTYVAIPQTGSLQVTINPSGAVSAGAQWQLDGGSWYSSGATVSGLSVGSHTVAFSTVTGWTTPGSQTPNIVANQTTTVTGTYSPVNGSVISLSGDLAFGAAAVGTELDNFLTIHNLGTGTLHVTNVICPAGFTGLCSGSIAAGGSTDVLIAFLPTLPASYCGTIVVTSDAGSGTNTIAVSGNGTSTDPHNPNIAIGVKMQPGNALVMTWPTNAVGFQLESTTNLGPTTNWTPVVGAPTIVNSQNVLTNSNTVHGMFFRLHQQ
jgi:hypothetical protein